MIAAVTLRQVRELFSKISSLFLVAFDFIRRKFLIAFKLLLGIDFRFDPVLLP